MRTLDDLVKDITFLRLDHYKPKRVRICRALNDEIVRLGSQREARGVECEALDVVIRFKNVPVVVTDDVEDYEVVL